MNVMNRRVMWMDIDWHTFARLGGYFHPRPRAWQPSTLTSAILLRTKWLTSSIKVFCSCQNKCIVQGLDIMIPDSSWSASDYRSEFQRTLSSLISRQCALFFKVKIDLLSCHSCQSTFRIYKKQPVESHYCQSRPIPITIYYTASRMLLRVEISIHRPAVIRLEQFLTFYNIWRATNRFLDTEQIRVYIWDKNETAFQSHGRTQTCNDKHVHVPVARTILCYCVGYSYNYFKILAISNCKHECGTGNLLLIWYECIHPMYRPTN